MRSSRTLHSFLMTVLVYCAAMHKNIDFFCHLSGQSWLNTQSKLLLLVKAGAFFISSLK